MLKTRRSAHVPGAITARHRHLRRHVARPLAGVMAAVLVVFAIGLTSRAQGGISITFGNGNSAVWAAGPDYATDVLADPWDMSNSEDIGLDPNETVGWSSFSVANGLAGGATANNDAQLSLLYRGRFDVINTGRTGRRFPIDTNRYQKLAFKMSDSRGAGDNPQVYWFHYGWNDPAIQGAGFGVRLLPGTVAGNQVYVVDLASAPSGGLGWNNGVPVRGLRIDPNGQNAGQTIQFDWVRLTTNDNAGGSAMQTISWSGGSGGATVDVIDPSGTSVNVTSNNGGSSVSWNYGILPPGPYTVRVTRGGATGTRSFTVNNPPIIQVTDPDEAGGEDYATTVLNNPWDMDSPGDVQITGADQYTPVPAVFDGGVMTATNTGGDPNLTVLNERNNSVPIDTSRYRFLTVRFSVDGPFDLGAGSVARVLWTSQQFLNGNTATVSKDIIVWPGMNDYTIDLAVLRTGFDGGLESAPAPENWQAGPKRSLRFDPHEFAAARTFHVDSIRLAAMDEANGSFTIRWGGSDPDGGNPSVALYYDNDTDASNGRTLIQTGLTMSQGSFLWNTSGVVPGDYYIYAEANDGVQAYGRYSTGTVGVRAGGGPPPPPPSGSQPAMSLDTPTQGAVVGTTFYAAGWAIDRGASAGPGVDAVHLYGFPFEGGGFGAGIFAGQGNYGAPRGDIAAVYGPQFNNSGYWLYGSLPRGTYRLIAYAHSTVTGTFNNSQFADIIVNTTSNPLMSLDQPGNGATVGQGYKGAGWAVDLGSGAGTGIDAVHVWAFPVGGGSPIFVAQAAQGAPRPDIGAAFGAQFGTAGFTFFITGIRGTYDLGVYAHSWVTGTFNQVRTVRINVQ